MRHLTSLLPIKRSSSISSSPDHLLQGRDFISQHLPSAYATPRAMSDFYPYQGVEPDSSCYMESANSDQPVQFPPFQEPLWDETSFDSSADAASNQTVAVPQNYGDSSNYNDGAWPNTVAPSSATTSDVQPYSAPPYPPNEYYMYPFPYSGSSSPSAGVGQDHANVIASETAHPIYPRHASPSTAHNSPLPSTSHGGIIASPLSNSTPLPHDASSSQLEKVTYTHREQAHFFREAVLIGQSPAGHPFVPQIMYKPHTSSDRRRYVEEVNLDPPIYFWVQDPSECGLALSDALHSRVRRLIDRDEPMFKDRGPSVSVRIEWPGYRPWSRQIPARDFRTPPCPITRSKLAKNVAKCVQRFIQERQGVPMEDDSSPDWRVGTQQNMIRVEDLVLVSLHHVSMGSWQPHLRLRRPLQHRQ
ncbi:hypothetical protein IW261DRAFT_1442193 [Armillaria novae-zelandiae]|uniref:Uncharacterized protein n=1 Tax=Armillaria novae-zelandiae TaxID=153914 RepID=A0AA39PR07_9AGAR|nr:hypothetical protein IW261DRAFT_1442193 [Armillaria novae-zelandiae]